MMAEIRDYVANRSPVPEGTLTQLLLETVDRFGERTAFQTIREGELQGIGYKKVLERAREVTGSLRSMGLQRGDRVAIISDSRPEWSQVDYGCLCAGVPLVPIHATLTASHASYILEDSGAKLVFASDLRQMAKAVEAAGATAEPARVVVFDPIPDRPEGTMDWTTFLEEGRRVAGRESWDAFRQEALLASPDDTATILYTSGTTGDPKGVVLTHNNIYSNVKATSQVIPIDDTDNTLSFLPLSHILQRMVDYLFFSRGAPICYGRSMQTVAEDLRIARPTKVVGPPRLYEKSYQTVMGQRGVPGLVVRWAREVGEAWAEERLAGREPTWILKVVYGMAHRLVFRKIHEGMGGRLVFFISGSAPLAPEINKFFYSAGIPILEGYGLTETSPATNVNTPSDFQIGTVGPPVPGTEIRIAQDGEILVRGPQVMKEYFNRPEDTARALGDGGWFHTGDIGEIDERGHLRITDRKKNLLVTAGGKNIAPAPIENRVKGCRYVDEVVMIGDRRHFPALLVVPAFDCLEGWARTCGIPVTTRRELLREPRVHRLMEEQIFGALGGLARYETPKKIGLLEREFTIEGGILTPNQKVRRRVIRERFGELIERLYDPANLDQTVFPEFA
jgi:long-chain acyl-CoA synthetase